jgi:hypothetical protein
MQRLATRTRTVAAAVALAVLAGGVDGGQPAGERPPQPLPADVVVAWTKAEAVAGWMRADRFGWLPFFRSKEGPRDLPAFRIVNWEDGILASLPAPQAPFGLHMILALIVLAFVATHTERLRGENPQVTAEQVCRALNQRCAMMFRRRRGIPELRHTSEVIRYHQRRNKQAADSHKKRRRRCII